MRREGPRFFFWSLLNAVLGFDFFFGFRIVVAFFFFGFEVGRTFSLRFVVGET